MCDAFFWETQVGVPVDSKTEIWMVRPIVQYLEKHQQWEIKNFNIPIAAVRKKTFNVPTEVHEKNFNIWDNDGEKNI